MRLKAQSAMEYLMTYGWAILIIAVVLGALFSLGVFSGTSLLGTSCIASSGFFCGGLGYSHTNGNVLLTFGQNTGSTWTSWAIMYAPQGTPVNTVSTAPNSLFYVQSGTLTSGQQAAVTSVSGDTSKGLPVIIPAKGTFLGPVSVGSTTAGSVWVCYTTGSSPGTLSVATGGCASSAAVYYSQVATLTAKAT